MLTRWSQFVPNMPADIRGHEALHHHHHHHQGLDLLTVAGAAVGGVLVLHCPHRDHRISCLEAAEVCM